MKKEELQKLVEGTLNFFNNLPGETSIGAPYPEPENTPMLDLTGSIGIAGDRKGCIYVTANKDMLKELCLDYAQIEEADESMIADMVGELANTMAGNAQSALGSNYDISIPLLIHGKPDKIEMGMNVPAFVIPFNWKNHKGYLVIGVQ